MIRLAVVGFGKWGRNYVAAARDSGEAEVALVVSRGGPPADFDLDGCFSTNIDGARDKVDAFVYAGHPSGAALACEQALAMDKPVLVEKPAGLSSEDAKRIQRAEAKSDAFVLVGHQHLFAAGYEHFREMTEDANVFWSEWGGPGPVRDFAALWDYGAHAVSVALGVLGGADDAHYFREDHGVSEFIAVQRGHRRAFVSWSNSAPGKTAEIAAEVDGIRIAYNAYASSAEPPLTSEVRAFARAAKDGGTSDWRFGARWAVDVARVLESASAGEHPVSHR